MPSTRGTLCEIAHRGRLCTLFSGQVPDFTMIDEEIELQAHRCNKKKKSAKTVEVCSSSSYTHTLTVTFCFSGAKPADVLCHIYKGELDCTQSSYSDKYVIYWFSGVPVC